MSGHVLAATVRLSVVGPDGRVDLTVPRWMSVASVAESYARDLGLPTAPALVDGSGATLDPDLDLEHAGLAHGDVLSVTGASAGTPDGIVAPAPPSARDPSTLPPAARTGMLAAAAVCALAAAALASASARLLGPASPDHARDACAVLLLLCAVLTSVLPAATGRARRAVSATSPAFGAAAGFVVASALDPSHPGGLLLGVAVAGFGATVFAAVGRTTLDAGHDELVEVWLSVGIGLAVVASALLLLGGTPTALVALAFATAVVAARVLPYAVVDVPDEALLDLDRLAVTAWSARERPRGGSRRRALVRAAGVGVVAGRASRLVTAGTVAVAVVVAVCGPLLVLGPGAGHGGEVAAGRDLAGVGALVMVAFGAVALALVARVFRARVPRFALRCSSAWVISVLVVGLVQAAAPAWRWGVFGAAAALASVVTGAAVALGNGWRSVWWARAADLVEGLSMVCTIATVVIASGLFNLVRGFVS